MAKYTKKYKTELKKTLSKIDKIISENRQYNREYYESTIGTMLESYGVKNKLTGKQGQIKRGLSLKKYKKILEQISHYDNVKERKARARRSYKEYKKEYERYKKSEQYNPKEEPVQKLHTFETFERVQAQINSIMSEIWEKYESEDAKKLQTTVDVLEPKDVNQMFDMVREWKSLESPTLKSANDINW